MTKDALPIIRAILDNLLLRNGKGTSQGFLTGILISGIFNLFSPVLGKIKFIEIEKLTIYHFIAGGILIMNLPYFTRKPSFPPDIEIAFNTIKEAKANGLSEVHIKQLYRQVCQMAIQNVQEQPPNQATETINAVGESISTIQENMRQP